MKLTNQLVAVIVASIVGVVILAVSLAVWADWSDGAVVGLVTVFGTIAVNLIVAIRNQQKTAEVLDDQNRQLDQITEQTNGLSDRERQDIANRAAAALMAKLKNDGHL